MNNLWLIDWLVSLDVRINPAVQSSPAVVDLGPTERTEGGTGIESNVSSVWAVQKSVLFFLPLLPTPNTTPSRLIRLITLFPLLCSLPFQFRRLLCSALRMRLIDSIDK